jgi:hypothetical protein
VSKFPRKKAEWVGKVLGLCFVLCAFSAMGILPMTSKPTSGVTDTAITTIATPTTSYLPSIPIVQSNQGPFTTLIVTGGISVTALLAAGVVIGIQRRKIQAQKKKKQGENLAISTSLEQSQNNIESALSPASSPHLIDQGLMRSPIMQDILQQSPALFIANEAAALPTDLPEQIATSLVEIPTQEIPAVHISLNDLETTEEQDTEPMAIIEKQENTAPLPALPQDLRTDPVLNAVRKQALMGIFVLLGQEKTDNAAAKEHESHESEEHLT